MKTCNENAIKEILIFYLTERSCVIRTNQLTLGFSHCPLCKTSLGSGIKNNCLSDPYSGTIVTQRTCRRGALCL